MIRTWPAQKAVYGLLNADNSGPTSFMGMVTGLLDVPDENQKFPYTTLGEVTGKPEDLLIETGASQTLMLHFWDRDAPASRIKKIMDRAIVLIHGKKPVLDEGQLVKCEVEFVEVIRDVDTWHGVMRVRIDTFQ